MEGSVSEIGGVRTTVIAMTHVVGAPTGAAVHTHRFPVVCACGVHGQAACVPWATIRRYTSSVPYALALAQGVVAALKTKHRWHRSERGQ